MGNNDVFAVIADKTRRGILTALKDGERPVGELVAELGVSQPTVSKHLKILRDAGMVSMEAQGQRRLYAVRPEPLAEVAGWVHDVVAGASAAEAPVDAAAPEPAAGTPEPAFVTPGPVPVPVPAAEEPVPAPSSGAPVPVPPAEEPVPRPALATPGPASVPAPPPEVPVPAGRELVAEAPAPETSAPGTTAPETSAPEATTRAGRGAGARAAGLLAGLPGFRRRPRHRRR